MKGRRNKNKNKQQQLWNIYGTEQFGFKNDVFESNWYEDFVNIEGYLMWLNFKWLDEGTMDEINAWKVVISLLHNKYILSAEHLGSEPDWNLNVRVRFSIL